MNIHPRSVLLTHEAKLRALCDLSDITDPVDLKTLIHTIQEAADPEVATHTILGSLSLSSDVLQRKWRDAITEVWASHHPHVPLLPNLQLSSIDVSEVPILQDAHAYLNALTHEPARLIEENDEVVLDPTDLLRIVPQLPSYQNKAVVPVESEWAYLPVRRLRAVLQALRLVRVVKGELVVVQSRLKRFQAFPHKQQWYALWHANAYHVDWHEYSGLWGEFMRVVQGYLPLLWELNEDAEPQHYTNPSLWTLEVIETFYPLWEEEGLLDVRNSSSGAMLPIIKQHSLPSIIEKFILRDLLERHGLVAVHESIGIAPQFTWTKIGLATVPAEANQELPCGIDLLNK